LINPAITLRTQRAILWALELHPDDRPENVEIFRDSLIGSRPIYTPTGRRIQPKFNIFQSKTEQILLILTCVVAILSLLITLLH